MSLKQTLENVLGEGASTHRCRGCSLTFDREPLNCPACGCSEIERQ